MTPRSHHKDQSSLIIVKSPSRFIRDVSKMKKEKGFV